MSVFGQPAIWVIVLHGKNINVVIFSDTINDKCQTLHDGSTHWVLPVHTTFSDIIDIFLHLKKKKGFFLYTIKPRSFKLCVIDLAYGLHFHSRFDDLDLCFKVTGVSEIKTVNCMFWILDLCNFIIVWLLHTKRKGHTQHVLFDQCVFKRDG